VLIGILENNNRHGWQRANLEESTKHSIRPLTPSDQLFLWEMLYQSLFVPEGGTAFDRSILDQPEIAVYVKDWGRPNDSGFVALDESAKPMGAVWLRLLARDEKGFGYVDDSTPELGMAVCPAFRGKGVGTSLLSHLLDSTEHVFDQICLSVSEENPAHRLYKRMGFEVVEKRGNSITMTRRSQRS
jgi:ribosomal protein S18 acetylase RimI-like enzyme